MARKLSDRFAPRRSVKIVMDDSIVVRDAMTAHLMQTPRFPRSF